jgi:hypothetical protein
VDGLEAAVVMPHGAIYQIISPCAWLPHGPHVRQSLQNGIIQAKPFEVDYQPCDPALCEMCRKKL